MSRQRTLNLSAAEAAVLAELVADALLHTEDLRQVHPRLLSIQAKLAAPPLNDYRRQCDVVLPGGDFCTLVELHRAPCTGEVLPDPVEECYWCWTAPRYPLDGRAQNHYDLHRAKVRAGS